MPQLAGVRRPAPPSSATTLSWERSWATASRRRSGSKSPMKWSVSGQTVADHHTRPGGRPRLGQPGGEMGPVADEGVAFGSDTATGMIRWRIAPPAC